MEYCKANRIGILLVSELSRLCRNAFEVLASVKELIDCGINLYIQKEQLILLDDEGHSAYYQLFTCEGKDNRLFVASYLGSIDGKSLKKGIDIPVYRSHRLATGKKYTPYFCQHDTLAIKLAHIDANSYTFWSDYSRNLTLSDNMFMAPTHNIRSNVKGAMGYWCGMGADVRYVVIGEETVPANTSTLLN